MDYLKLDKLPPELLYVIDDYCDIEQHGNLKLTCEKLYSILNGKGLKRLHIGYSIHDSVIDRYLNDQCSCQEEYGMRHHCMGYRCRKRWLFLTPQKYLLLENYDYFQSTLLSHVTSLSVKFGDGEWAQDLLKSILPYMRNIELVEISYVGEKFNQKLWKDAVNCFQFMPNIEKAEVKMYTTHCPRMFAEVLSQTIPNMKCFPLMILDSDLDHLNHPLFIQPFQNLHELEILINIESYNFIASEQLGGFLSNLPYLTQLQLFGSPIYNPRGVKWIPYQLSTITLDTVGYDFDFDGDYGPTNCPLNTKSNGDFLRELIIFTITHHEADSMNLQNLKHFTSYYQYDSITKLLLSRIHFKSLLSLHITTDHFVLFFNDIQRMSSSLQSLTMSYGYRVNVSELYRFIQRFIECPEVYYPNLEFYI